MAVIWHESNTKTNRCRNNNADLHIRIYAKGKPHEQTCITFSERLMIKCRLYIGDTLKFAYDDEDEFIYLKRSAEGNTYTISKSGAGKGVTEKSKGKSLSGSIKMVLHAIKLPESSFTLNELILDDKNYTIAIPVKAKIVQS